MRRITSISVVFSTLLLISISLAQQPASTAVPNLIRYGGVLKDAQGAAVSSATTGVTLAIYKQQDGGAAVWMETQNVTTDAGGNYSLLLGSTTVSGLPSDLFSQQEQRWLGVQVQGQAEQPRVLLVSVPYAFKAHEAETLSGKSISDFVLAKDANSSTSGASSVSQAGSPTANNSAATKTGTKTNAASQGPTNFSGATTDQIIQVMQSGTGNGINVFTTGSTTSYAAVGSIRGPGVAIFGHASSPTAQGYGIEGVSDSTIGVGLLGFATATTGPTYGLKGYSSSTAGTGVRGLSTATTGGTTGVSGQVESSGGTAGVFTNTAGGKILSGRSNSAEQFSVDGSGNIKFGADLAALSTGTPVDKNLFIGVGAGASNVSGSGQYNVFSGYQAGAGNLTGQYNVFCGAYAGQINATGSDNTFCGAYAGQNNEIGDRNAFYGAGAGEANTSGSYNTFSGVSAGSDNTIGNFNSFFGLQAGLPNTSGNDNSFFGTNAGGHNISGSQNFFAGNAAGLNNTTGSSDVYVANIGPPSGTESNATRIGFPYSTDPHICGPLPAPCGQSAAYIAGVYDVNVGISLPVVINSIGQLGTSAAGGAGVTSWNSRTGAVVPLTGDYTFPMIGGSLSPSQVPAGSPDYIQNGTVQQTSASFNISGSGTANTFNSATNYQIGGTTVFSTQGSANTFAGADAGGVNSSGNQNVFVGASAGANNVAGSGNTFIGYNAGLSSTTGAGNIFIGSNAGGNNWTGSSNIYIGNSGPSSGQENTTIRIGSTGMLATYIGGIYGTTVGSNGIPVNVDSNGQLGTVVSSLRFKEQIADMGDTTDALMKLRPVTFLYKPEYSKGDRTLQYGLIAEEVAKVYPDMVAYERDGQPYTVKYQNLAPMLLNELQKQHTVVSAQQGVIETQQQQIESLQKQNVEFQQRLARLESLIEKK